MTEFEIRRCRTCEYWSEMPMNEFPCNECAFDYTKWKCNKVIENWLNSFDTTSATKCFEAVNLLKQRLEE